MSNAQTQANGHYSIDKYRKAVKGTPFVLDLDEDKQIVVQRPKGQAMFDAEEAMRSGDSKGVLKALCGDAYDLIMDQVVPNEDAVVVVDIIADIEKHFGLGESTASSRS